MNFKARLFGAITNALAGGKTRDYVLKLIDQSNVQRKLVTMRMDLEETTKEAKKFKVRKIIIKPIAVDTRGQSKIKKRYLMSGIYRELIKFRSGSQRDKYLQRAISRGISIGKFAALEKKCVATRDEIMNSLIELNERFADEDINNIVGFKVLARKRMLAFIS